MEILSKPLTRLVDEAVPEEDEEARAGPREESELVDDSLVERIVRAVGEARMTGAELRRSSELERDVRLLVRSMAQTTRRALDKDRPDSKDAGGVRVLPLSRGTHGQESNFSC